MVVVSPSNWSRVHMMGASATRIAHRGRRAFAVARLPPTRQTSAYRVAIALSTRTAAQEDIARLHPRQLLAPRALTIATPQATRASTTRTALALMRARGLPAVSTTRRRNAGHAVKSRFARDFDPGPDKERLMARTALSISTMALMAVFGCGGREK